MAEKYRVKWSREETILAFDLYCKTPFSKIGKSNKDIIELANLLGRTPSSVGLKMANLAHFDPELRARNVSGMANASKLDAEIFQEFSQDWTELSYQAQLIKAKNISETSKERAAIECKDMLVCVSVDQELNEMEYVFEGELLSKVEYVACVMQHGRKDKLEIGRLNMSPIIRAFEKCKQNKEK